jgi:hypothetical protein
MSIQPALIALLVILIFVSLLLLAIRTSQRQIAEKTHQALTLGYEEVTSRPSQLISRVETLFKRRENLGVHVDQVYSKRDWDQEFFIFDAYNSSEDDNEMGSEIFGVISNQLALPQFSLTTLPGFDSGTLIGGLMEKMLDKVLELAGKYQGLSRIEFPDRADFNEQIIVFGKDQGAVRELIDRIPISSILSIKSPMHITGLDDFLTVDFSHMGSLKDPQTDLIAQHGEFTRILSYFTK